MNAAHTAKYIVWRKNMKLHKLTAVMMAAAFAVSTPAGAVLGQMTAYADTDKSKDYEISGAEWETETDSRDKLHIYATWEPSDDSTGATITIYRNDSKTGTTVSTTTTKGSIEVTSYIKKIGKTGEYSFKIKAKSKSKDEDGKTYGEVAESESDYLEIDSSTLKSLSSTSATSSGTTSSTTSSGATPGSTIPTTTTTTNTSTSVPTGTAPTTTQTTQSAEVGDFLQNGVWANWQIGWVYLVNNTPVHDKWVYDSQGRLFHIGSNGFMDVNRTFTDYTGTHTVGADGVLVK